MVTEQLAEIIENALGSARQDGSLTFQEPLPRAVLEKPANRKFGDFSTNIALSLKKSTGLSDSRAIAACLIAHLNCPAGLIDRVEQAGPGFINFYLNPLWLHAVAADAIRTDTAYGSNQSMAGERILIEFVSANPTGPISVVNGRAAALGDVLANLMTACGAAVEREYYINDALNSLQLEKFADTVVIRYLQQLGHPIRMPSVGITGGFHLEPGEDSSGDSKEPVDFPPGGYQGEYVKDIARSIVQEHGDRFEYASEHERATFFRAATLKTMVAAQAAALASFGVHYDTWFYESSLYESNAVDRVIEELKARDFAYEMDGALWLRSSALGDEKDRVLIRSNEKATYIAADAAYHDHKFRRGFSRLIDIMGADHHGYVARIRAGVAALGYDEAKLRVILTQMVSLVRDGETVIGGKRSGNIIELKEDLVDEIGKDAARFYFLLNSYETPATVDVELARKQTNENPVYYVQYAHARLCSLLRKAAESGFTAATDVAGLSFLQHEKELEVARKLSEFPAEIEHAVAEYAPHRLTRYTMELASALNIFYENCRVLPGTDANVEPHTTSARLGLVDASRIVMRNALKVLGVSAPDSM